MKKCSYCNKEYDHNQVIRSLGVESSVVKQGMCSAQCYTKKMMEQEDETPVKIGQMTEVEYKKYQDSSNPKRHLLKALNDDETKGLKFHHGNTMMTLNNPEQYGLYKYRWKNGLNYVLVVSVEGETLAWTHTLTELKPNN